MNEEHRHGTQRDQRQNHTGQVGFNPVHLQPGLRRRRTSRFQPHFIADVINGVKRRGRQQRLQQILNRHHVHVKAKYQHGGQREAEVKGQQKQQRKEQMEVKTDALKLPPGQRQNKNQRQQIDHQQAPKLHKTHDNSPSLSCNAARQPAR